VGFEATLVECILTVTETGTGGETIAAATARGAASTLLSPLFETPSTVQDPLVAPPRPPPPPPPISQTQTVGMVIEGMTCTMCSSAITRALEGVHGVLSAKVNLATNLATIDYNYPQVNPEVLQETIESV
jgi:copper chaperone CopZ